jgi:hypothetical protein
MINEFGIIRVLGSNGAENRYKKPSGMTSPGFTRRFSSQIRFRSNVVALRMLPLPHQAGEPILAVAPYLVKTRRGGGESNRRDRSAVDYVLSTSDERSAIGSDESNQFSDLFRKTGASQRNSTN